jgi:hypothetical protein
MGKLIKNHWARLIVLSAAVFQIAAAIEGFIWPKIFWDFSTTKLDVLVRPVPYLQNCNLSMGLTTVAFELPLFKFVARSPWHRYILPRVVGYMVTGVVALLLYQTSEAGVYYLIGTGLYLWGFLCGEVSRPMCCMKMSER